MARAIRITFSEPVEITGFGDTFDYQSPKGKATIFVFTGTPLDEWWTLWVSWSLDSAGVVEMEWLKTGGGVQLDINIGDEPPTLDPTTWDASRSTWYPIEQLFLGLVDYDAGTGEIIPELATSWEVSEDAIVWTFTLRDDVTWTDGRPVTAEDVRYGILQTLNPALNAPQAYVLYCIENAEDYNKGEITDASQVGIETLDDRHL